MNERLFLGVYSGFEEAASGMHASCFGSLNIYKTLLNPSHSANWRTQIPVRSRPLHLPYNFLAFFYYYLLLNSKTYSLYPRLKMGANSSLPGLTGYEVEKTCHRLHFHFNCSTHFSPNGTVASFGTFQRGDVPPDPDTAGEGVSRHNNISEPALKLQKNRPLLCFLP